MASCLIRFNRKIRSRSSIKQISSNYWMYRTISLNCSWVDSKLRMEPRELNQVATKISCKASQSWSWTRQMTSRRVNSSSYSTVTTTTTIASLGHWAESPTIRHHSWLWSLKGKTTFAKRDKQCKLIAITISSRSPLWARLPWSRQG